MTPDPAAVPDGWQEVRLGDVAAVNQGLWDPADGSAILYLDLTSVVEPGRLSAPVEMRAEAAPSRARRRVRTGDILVSTVRPYLRGFARVREAPKNLIASTGFAVLTPQATSDGSLLYHHVMSPSFARHLEANMTGQAYPAVRPDDVAGYPLALPPLAEQRAIAAVLDAIDEAIERTEEVIAATERLRDALLHELLTRGLPGRHSEWVDVPGLGTVPACWDVVRLGEVGRWLSGGTPSKARPDYWSGTLPWVSPKDMKAREIRGAQDHITEEAARAGSRVVPPGTIFVVVRGMILIHSFPLAVSRVAAAFNQDVKALLCRDGLLPGFVLAGMEHQKPRLLQLPTPSTHGTMRVVSDELFALQIPAPPLDEQRAIADVLDGVDGTIERAREERARLHSLQASVADALLTGRVRVAGRPRVVGASKGVA